MKADRISLEYAKPDKLFYFVANVAVYRETDGRCLVLKRSERETAHPGKYAFIGGKLEWKDLDLAHSSRVNGDVIDFENTLEGLLRREAQEEAGIEIDCNRLLYLNSVAYVRPDGIPTMLVKVAARYVGGEITLEQGSFTDYAWVDSQEVLALDCIDGIRDEIDRLAGIL